MGRRRRAAGLCAAEEAAIRSLFADFGLGICAEAMLARCSEINKNYYGIDRLVASLRGRFRQYAVSNGAVAAQARKLARSGFDKLMDGIFLSERTGYEKPAAEFFNAVFREIGEERRACSIIVGDSLTSDMEGANRAGIKSCWYDPGGAEKNACAKPDYEIKI